jgi:isoleucyl-tRNA synthetase
MQVSYKEYQQLDLPGISAEVLANWKENRAFEKSVALREGQAPFVL